METIIIISGSILFGISLLFLYHKMKKEKNSFTWDSYFEQCDIYQGRSHWTRLKKIIRNVLTERLKRKNNLKENLFR